MRDKQYAANHGDRQMFGSSSEDIDFRIDKQAYAALIDRMTDAYSAPAIAAVREVFSNAYDASIAEFKKSGSRNEIVISLPDFANDYHLSIRDNGIGMDMDTVKDVLVSYGNSTKATDNSSTGAYGLGVKSPLAVVNTFNLATVKDGVKVSFVVIRHPGSIPKAIDVKTSPTNEGNGTTVSIPTSNLSNKEVEQMVDTAHMAAHFCSDFPVVLENSDTDETVFNKRSNSLKKYYNHAGTFEHGNEKFNIFVFDKMVKSSLVTNLQNVSLNRARVHFLLNGYLYAASHNVSDGIAESPYRQPEIIIELKPGVVDFPTSRDSVTDNERMSNLIHSFRKHIFTINDFGNIIANVISKNTSSDNLIDLDYIDLLTLFYSYENKNELIHSILSFDQRTNYFGDSISLGSDFVKLANNIVKSDDYFNFSAFSYNFEDKSSSKILKNFNTEDYPRKTLFNESFTKSFEKMNSDESKEETVSTRNFLSQLQNKDRIVIIGGTDKKTPSFSRKINSVDNTFGSFYTSRNAIFILPPHGELKTEDKEFFESFSQLTNVETVFYNSFKDVPMIKKENPGLNKSTFYYTIEINNNLVPNTIASRLIKSNFESYFTKFYGVKSYNEIVDELNELNTHLVIVPTPKGTEKSVGSNSYFKDALFQFIELFGDNFVKDTKFVIIESPMVTLIKELNEKNVEYTVLGDKERFKSKALAQKAIPRSKAQCEIEAVMNTYTDEELKKELIYQLSLSINRDYNAHRNKEKLTELFEFIVNNPAYFTTESIEFSHKYVKGIKVSSQYSHRSNFSDKIRLFSYNYKNGIIDLFKDRVTNAESYRDEVSNITTTHQAFNRATNTHEVFYVIKNLDTFENTVGIEAIIPVAKYVVKEVMNQYETIQQEEYEHKE